MFSGVARGVDNSGGHRGAASLSSTAQEGNRTYYDILPIDPIPVDPRYMYGSVPQPAHGRRAIRGGKSFFLGRVKLSFQSPPCQSQGSESPTEPSPEALKAFYQDMERRDTMERKLSKRRSNSITSLWSRKSVKRNLSVTAPPQNDQPTRPPSAHTPYKTTNTGSLVEANVIPPLLPTSRSIIPDAMSESSPAYNKDTWGQIPMPAFKVRYHIHNPHGPRWYKNHHLIPPSQVKPNVRPPSFFSTSFPPISTTSAPERLDDPGPSRTPSHSPLPTPTSSQTRVADPGGKPRSRKTSQTTPDNVDLLDVTDPWGTNWHHRSPYDLAISANPSGDTHEAPNRTRRASMTATQSKHQSVTPSPLSQSTSAVHLQPPAPDGTRIPRKLSKRTTPAVNNIFGSNDDRKAASAPVTPVDHYPHPHTLEDATPDQSQLPKRMSVAPVMSAPSNLQPTSKKEKRGSVLGRLAKKFSILRRGTDDQDDRDDSWHYVYPEESRRSVPAERGRSASPEKSQVDPVRRVPPPSMADTLQSNFAGPSTLPSPPREHDRSSSISVETPFSIGKLTIANPDTPDAESPNPFDQPPLPPEKPKDLYPPSTFSHVRADSRSNTFPNSPPPETVSPPPPTSVYSPAPISLYLAPLVSVTQTPPETSQTPLPPEKSKIPAPSTSSSSGHGHMHHQRQTTQEYPNTQRHVAPSSVHVQPEVQPASIQWPSSSSTPTPTAAQALISDVRNSTRLAEKPQPSLPNPSSPEPPRSTLSVPFPGSDGFLPPMERLSSLMSYDGSPLSTSSMLANPPTPYNPRLSITATPGSIPPPLPPKSQERDMQREPSPIDKTAGRQTETFKLIRSASGNVYASSETIVAAGQQWEVVESVDDKRKRRISSSKSKDKEGSARKEKENAGGSLSKPRVETDVDDHHTKSRGHRSKHTPTAEGTPSPSKSKSTHKTGGHRDDSSRTEEYQSSRKRDEKDDERKSSRRRDEKEEQHRSRRRDDREEEQRSSRRREERGREKEEERRRREEREREKEEERRRREEKEREDERRSIRRREEEEEERRRRKEKEREEERRRWEEREREEERRKREEKEREREDGRRRREEREREDEHRKREEKEKEEERRSERRREEKEEERKASRRRDEKDDDRKSTRRRDEKDEEYRSSRRKDEDEHRSSRRREEKEDNRRREDDEERKSSRRKEEKEDDHKSSRRRDEKDEEHRSKHRRDEDRHRKSERKTEVPAGFNPDVDTAQLYLDPNQPVERPLERHPSTSTRPTSELPSAADMNALRAKEAWDLERLWKARSMHGLEPDGAGPSNYIPASGSSMISDDATTTGGVYGSSHTAFVVQTPFQGHPSHIYHSMPTAPPPFVYPSSIPSIHGSTSSYGSPYMHRTYPDSYPPPDSYPSPDPWPPSSASRNPLPPPPQESPYQPTPLPRLPPTNGHGRSSDHWTSKYTGVTTAH